MGVKAESELKPCRHCGERAARLNEHKLGCRLLFGLAQRAADGYKPGELDQRPPLDLVEGRMHEMLDQALTHGFVTGSVGCTWKEEDYHFAYEMSYTIKRKRKPGYGHGDAE